MADHEKHVPGSDAGADFDVTPESIEAFRHSHVDLNEFLEKIKQTNGKLALELYALSEDYRQHGAKTAEDKTAFINGLLTVIKLREMQKGSEPLAEIFELPVYTDENHTPTDGPPLSA